MTTGRRDPREIFTEEPVFLLSKSGVRKGWKIALCPCLRAKCQTLSWTAKNFAPIQSVTDSKWKYLPCLKAALQPICRQLIPTALGKTSRKLHISCQMFLLSSVNKLSFVRFYTAYITLYQLQRNQVAFAIINWKSAAQARHSLPCLRWLSGKDLCKKGRG